MVRKLSTVELYVIGIFVDVLFFGESGKFDEYGLGNIKRLFADDN